MATELAREQSHLGHQEFDAFMTELSKSLGVESEMIVRAMRQCEEGHLPESGDLVRKLFVIRQKEYKYGSSFSRSDWTVVCRNCDWLNAETFTQGDCEMVFSQQCRANKVGGGKTGSMGG